MAKVYLTGDLHSDPRRFGKKAFLDLTKDDLVVVLGDFGLMFEATESKTERYWLDWLESKPFTTLFLDGNHENFDRLNALPVESRFGGRVHMLRPSVVHLMRGELYDLNGFKTFVFGGAPSHDIQGFATDEELARDYTTGILKKDDPNFKKKKDRLKKQKKPFRVEHVNWWRAEFPSDTEFAHGLDTLEKANFHVDLVLTHDAPETYRKQLNTDVPHSTLNDYFEQMRVRLSYKHWFFGHYHRDTMLTDTDGCLYESVLELT